MDDVVRVRIIDIRVELDDRRTTHPDGKSGRQREFASKPVYKRQIRIQIKFRIVKRAVSVCPDILTRIGNVFTIQRQ